MTPYSFYKLPFEEQLKTVNTDLLSDYDFYRHSMENRRKLLIAANPAWETLEAKLLAIGGERVVPQVEPHLDMLVARGVKFAGKSISHKLTPSSCHSNTAFLHMTNKPGTFAIVTGWALTKNDGLWRQHTWGRYMESVTIETTVKRSKYFGVILTDDEAQHFATCNFPVELLELFPEALEKSA